MVQKIKVGDIVKHCNCACKFDNIGLVKSINENRHVKVQFLPVPDIWTYPSDTIELILRVEDFSNLEKVAGLLFKYPEVVGLIEESKKRFN